MSISHTALFSIILTVSHVVFWPIFHEHRRLRPASPVALVMTRKAAGREYSCCKGPVVVWALILEPYLKAPGMLNNKCFGGLSHLGTTYFGA